MNISLKYAVETIEVQQGKRCIGYDLTTMTAYYYYNNICVSSVEIKPKKFFKVFEKHCFNEPMVYWR